MNYPFGRPIRLGGLGIGGERCLTLLISMGCATMGRRPVGKAERSPLSRTPARNQGRTRPAEVRRWDAREGHAGAQRRALPSRPGAGPGIKDAGVSAPRGRLPNAAAVSGSPSGSVAQSCSFLRDVGPESSSLRPRRSWPFLRTLTTRFSSVLFSRTTPGAARESIWRS
jgi:hypothetical protein